MGELRQRGRIWWIRYYRDGRRFEESAKTDKYEKARDMLKQKEGDVANGVPFSPAMGRMKFEEAMTDLETEYTVNKRDSLEHLKRRIKLHLKPWFRGRRMTKITTADVNAYVQRRQERKARRGDHQPRAGDPEARVHPGDSGRQVAAGHRPYIAMLQEHNVRTGFFEADQFTAVKRQLPAGASARRRVRLPHRLAGAVRGAPARMAARRPEGRHRHAGPRHTKNGEGRTIYLTAALRTLLEAQKAAGEALAKTQEKITPRVFHRHGKPIRGLLQGLAECLRGRRLSGQAPARLPADRRPELRPGRHPRAGGDGDERPQDAVGVRSLRHRQPDRPADRRGHARFRGRDNRRDKIDWREGEAIRASSQVTDSKECRGRASNPDDP